MENGQRWVGTYSNGETRERDITYINQDKQLVAYITRERSIYTCSVTEFRNWVRDTKASIIGEVPA